MDKERLIEFLRKIPPTAQFSIDGKLVKGSDFGVSNFSKN